MDTKELVWGSADSSLIPDWVYTDQSVFDLEMQRIFHGAHWIFVGLESEIPKAGDFRRSYVGTTPVVVTRDRDLGINVFENRCTHRGVEFCRKPRGNTKTFVCPLHYWSFDLKGDLRGVPFQKGREGRGGMPPDFRMEDHNLRKLRTESYNGLIYATYSEQAEPLAEYLGPEIREFMDSLYKDRTIRVNGYETMELKCNWKAYMENLKDPYHATLLHSYFVVFGLVMAANRSSIIPDSKHGRHSITTTVKQDDPYAKIDAATVEEMPTYTDKIRLRDERPVQYIKEHDSEWSSFVMTVFPNMLMNRQMNGMTIRQLVPLTPDTCRLTWIMIGYDTDDEAMIHHRMRQDNLHGPAGIISMEDQEVLEFQQQGYRRSTTEHSFLDLEKGNDSETTDTIISEVAIRSMYDYYRRVMGFQK